MAKTFMDMVKEAREDLESISPADAMAAVEADPNTLIIDVRDAADIEANGIIPGAVAISLGTLGYKGDVTLPQEMQHPELGDHDRPIITTCFIGAMASLGAKTLKDLGYTNVKYVEGGTNGYVDAGFKTTDFKA